MDAPNQGNDTSDTSALLAKQLDGCRSLGELLARQAASTPLAPAFSCAGHEVSYARLDWLSTRLALWLLQLPSMAAGERVALQLPNGLAYPVIAMAVFKAGLVLVNISARAADAERLAMLRDCGARVLFVHDPLMPEQLSDLSAIGISVLVRCQPDALHPSRALEQQTDGEAARPDVKETLQTASLRRILDQPVVSAMGDGKFPEINPGTLALLQFTGGSTGHLKAAMLSHGNLLSNLAQLRERLGAVYPETGSLMLAPLPFSHIYAFTMNLLGGIAHGHHTLVIADAGDIDTLVSTLLGRSFRGMSGVDSFYRRLCAHPRFRQLDFSGLKIASAGGMALTPVVARQWQQMTGCALTEGYGLTECAPLVCCSPAGMYPPGTLGKPLAATRVSIRNGWGEALPEGAEGEVCVKGPQVMAGYWNKAEEDAQSFDTHGWFHTGDIGRIDAAGNLWLCGRLKDMIIIGGFKVYPRELEACALAHPAVVDACALGYGPVTGQQIALFVVCSAPLDASELRRWCRASMAAFKVPGRIEFVSQLPRSAAGKLQRQPLARLLAAQ